MATHTQANRLIRVSTGLGADKLLLQSFAGQESISMPFSYTLELWSEDAAIDPQQVLANPACITLELPAGGTRSIHGRVSRFTQLGRQKELVAYRAELVPWLWFLSLSSDCRIFQRLTVLEIVEKVFKAHGYSDFQLKCGRSYAKREYCVQYRETDLNFVSRLLEEEGIFYYFEHSNNKHVLILADDSTRVDPCPGQSVVRMAAQAGAWQDDDVTVALELEHAVQVGKVTLRDYDYLQPTIQLESSISGNGSGEVYEYPGSYVELGGAGNAPQMLERYARLILEEREAWSHVVRGQSTCRSLQSGYSFELKEHYRANANQTYRLLHVQHGARAADYLSNGGGALFYQNSFVALPRGVPYRPPRTAPKPIIQGSQTAVVVGKAGEEVWVDAHGRVKVQFYWDRNGKKNEDSSCWVRVATSWAGKNWGFIQIPRIGQEVIVDFLEGDPDRPIITGRVYNADQAPPFTLPGDQTQSGIKSRSLKGGGTDNFNELRFEDKKGSEQIFIHAEKDMQVEVEHDRTESVGNDESVSVGNNQTISIGKDRKESVGKDESITIDKNRTESVGGNESVTIDGNRSLTVSKDESIDVTGKRTDSVGKDESVTIGDNRTHKVGKDDKLSVGKNLAIDAADSITLKTGDATITMKKSGDIKIKGKDVSIEASGKISIKASSDVNIKGSKVTGN